MMSAVSLISYMLQSHSGKQWLVIGDKITETVSYSINLQSRCRKKVCEQSVAVVKATLVAIKLQQADLLAITRNRGKLTEICCRLQTQKFTLTASILSTNLSECDWTTRH